VIVLSFVAQSGQQEVLDSLLVLGAIVGGASLLVFFFISLLLARWIVRPVDKAWKEQRQFISDASHELKTPLSVIMTNAELLQGTALPEEKNRYGWNIFLMSLRMRQLVEGMLNLSRVDNGQVKRTFKPLDFSALVETAVLPFEPMFFENNLTLQSNVEKGIFVNGNDRYLSQVVHILLDNAQKYSEPGIVELQLQRYGRSQVLLTVSNPGNPIAPADRERIFDRFYRVDEARTGSGSFGLGLAIAKSMVTEHGGSIWVESNKTGNCFCILLPCIT
jgi:signal transduction histidine kinase